MTSMTLEISETRTITATGRLVAGETAQVTISGATPAALYLVAPDQTVVAACEAFTPSNESGGVGYLQLATEQVAALFANTPAGRMIAVWALVNDADGVAGAGWVPVVSAPMPDALIDLDIDFYLRASQVGAGLAIVDGKLVCTVNPDNYLTKAEAAATYATRTELAGKFGIDSDSEAPSFWAVDENGRQGFYARGAVYLLPNGEGAAAGGTLARLADIPAAPVQSVNGQTGAVELDASEITNPSSPSQGASVATDIYALYQSKASTADLRYALDAEPRDPDIQTGKYALDDRAANWIQPDGASVTIVFPPPIEGRLRDFEVYVESLNSGTGNVSLTCEGHDSEDVLTLGNGAGAVPDVPLGGETVLYFSEVREGRFLLKGEEFKTIAQGGN